MSSFREMLRIVGVAVTLRCYRAAIASKGDGIERIRLGQSSFEARRWRGSHLRMTAAMLAFFSLNITTAFAAEPGHFGYGTVPTAEQMAGWDIDARGEDGAGLPPGKGGTAAMIALISSQPGRRIGSVRSKQCASTSRPTLPTGPSSRHVSPT